MTYKGIPIKVPADFSAQTEGQKNVHDVLKSDEREKPITKSTLLSKGLIQIWWRNQKLYRQARAKKIEHHKTSFITTAKETLRGRKENSTAVLRIA